MVEMLIAVIVGRGVENDGGNGGNGRNGGNGGNGGLFEERVQKGSVLTPLFVQSRG